MTVETGEASVLAHDDSPFYPTGSLVMNELLADAAYRHVTEEPSEWLVEMRARSDEFEASNYQDPRPLHLGEGYPEEPMLHHDDENVQDAMRALKVAVRKHAKAAYEHCPVDTDAYLAPINSKILLPGVPEEHHKRRVMPVMYGPLGRVIHETVDRTFAWRTDPRLGPYRLIGHGGDRHHAATEKEVDSWAGLKKCWTVTLQASARSVLSGMKASGDPSVVVLMGIRGLYPSLEGSEDSEDMSLTSHIEGGCTTAALSCTRVAYAMNAYLLEQGIVNEGDRAAILARSRGPILKMAALELTQLNAFNRNYMGHRVGRKEIKTDFSRIRTDIYTLKNGRVDFTRPLEELGLDEGVDPGKLLARTQIGCPILFTPGLVRELWGAYVESLDRVGLLSQKATERELGYRARALRIVRPLGRAIVGANNPGNRSPDMYDRVAA